jgi:hypothetical protein
MPKNSKKFRQRHGEKCDWGKISLKQAIQPRMEHGLARIWQKDDWPQKVTKKHKKDGCFYPALSVVCQF